jgi:hypothetical protein
MEICTSWYAHKTENFADINLSVEKNNSSVKYYIKQTANKAFVDIIPWPCPGCIKQLWMYGQIPTSA